MDQQQQQQQPEDVREILEAIVRAQGDLNEGMSNKALAGHLRKTLYPLLSRAVNVVAGVGESFDRLVDVMDGPRDQLTEQSAAFVDGFAEAVIIFVQEHAAEAEALSQSGTPQLLQELNGLFAGAEALRGMVSAIMTEDPDDGDGGSDGQG